MFKTRVTELLGIEHPIIAGTMGAGLSKAELVAADPFSHLPLQGGVPRRDPQG